MKRNYLVAIVAIVLIITSCISSEEYNDKVKNNRKIDSLNSEQNLRLAEKLIKP